jgi:hypothetical protein
MMALSCIWMLQNGQLKKGEFSPFRHFTTAPLDRAKVRNELLFIAISRRHNRQ